MAKKAKSMKDKRTVTIDLEELEEAKENLRSGYAQAAVLHMALVNGSGYEDGLEQAVIESLAELSFNDQDFTYGVLLFLERIIKEHKDNTAKEALYG